MEFKQPGSTGYIEMKPVCSECKYVFELDEVEIVTLDCSDGKLSYRKPQVSPLVCPSCSIVFAGISIPLDFENKLVDQARWRHNYD